MHNSSCTQMFTAQLESVDLVSKFRVFNIENKKKKTKKQSCSRPLKKMFTVKTEVSFEQKFLKLR